MQFFSSLYYEKIKKIIIISWCIRLIDLRRQWAGGGFPAACKHSFIHFVHWADDWVTLCWSEGLEESHFFRARLQSASLLIIRLSHAAGLFHQNPFKCIHSKIFISNSVFLFISTGPFKRNRSALFYREKWKKLFLVSKEKKKERSPKYLPSFFSFFSPVSGNGGPNEKGADQGGMNHRGGKNRVLFLRERRQYHGVRRRSNQRGTFTAFPVRLTPGPLD